MKQNGVEKKRGVSQDPKKTKPWRRGYLVKYNIFCSVGEIERHTRNGYV